MDASPWTYPELAEMLAQSLGKPVRYREVPDEEAGMFAQLFPLVRAGMFAQTSPDLELLLGRPPDSLKQAVAAFVQRVQGADAG